MSTVATGGLNCLPHPLIYLLLAAFSHSGRPTRFFWFQGLGLNPPAPFLPQQRCQDQDEGVQTMSYASRRYRECLAPGDVWPLVQMCHNCCPLLIPFSYPKAEGITRESNLANKLTSGYISIQANKNQFLYSLFDLLSPFAISHLCLVNSYFF